MGKLDIRDIVQALLALIIVIGAFYVAVTAPSNPNLSFITGIAGGVIGYYFNRFQKQDSSGRHEG